MGSLSSLFNLARNSLVADQAALTTTANNVANQNTAGYTREVATFQGGDSVQLGGKGAPTISTPTVLVVSQRDRVLEQRVQQQAQAGASTAALSSVLSQIQNVFSLTGSSSSPGSTQIGTAIDSFFSSLASLSASPADNATGQAVITAAKNLASAFNSAASQLSQISAGLNSSISDSVTTVNALASTIAKLNLQIGASSATGDAGVLEDQRQNAITQLSQYIGLDQIKTENNGITLTTSSGTPLVSAGSSFALNASIVSGASKIVDGFGNTVTAGISGGSIGGELTAQNVDLPQVASALDAVAYRIASAVNGQNSAGLTSGGVSGTALFAITATASGSAAAISVLATTGTAVATAAAREGSSGNTNVLALAAIQQAIDPAGNTIGSSYASLLGQVGDSASSLTETSAVQQATLTQLTTQRDSLSKVGLDEEAANLSQYQNAYNAAAKLLTILDTLMAGAINLGTPTTVT